VLAASGDARARAAAERLTALTRRATAGFDLSAEAPTTGTARVAATTAAGGTTPSAPAGGGAAPTASPDFSQLS
ncbi:MAG TPA: hypothetical protein VEC10_01635, partial [Steroidobacteraceae bacterium]|nr:hypothetical protein [Steroidobacteraceae bacterium]